MVQNHATAGDEGEGIWTPEVAALVIRKEGGVALGLRFEEDNIKDVFGEVGEHLAGDGYGTFGNNQLIRSALDDVRVAFGEAGFELPRKRSFWGTRDDDQFRNDAHLRYECTRRVLDDAHPRPDNFIAWGPSVVCKDLSNISVCCPIECRVSRGARNGVHDERQALR